jgi:hypothetical protein
MMVKRDYKLYTGPFKGAVVEQKFKSKEGPPEVLFIQRNKQFAMYRFVNGRYMFDTMVEG